jgi:hypothetical protein
MKQLLSLILTMFCIAPAWADTYASATVSNMAATLYDLDLLDGISPAITFNQASEYNANAGYSFFGSQLGKPIVPLPSEVSSAVNKFGPIVVSGASETALAGAEVSGDGTLSGTVLHAWGRSTSSDEFERSYYAGAGMLRDTSNAYSAQAFTLTPHTLVVFTADVSLHAEVTNSAIPRAQMGYESATAYSQLLVFEQGVGYDTGPQESFDQPTVFESTPGFSNNIQETVSVRFKNVTFQNLTGALGISADVSGKSGYATIVPEPATGASLICGLALLLLFRLAQTNAQTGRSQLFPSNSGAGEIVNH